MWAVLVIEREKKVEVTVGAVLEGVEIVAPLCWADGMIGCMPIFDNEEKALKYANGGFQVVPLQVGK